MSSIKAAQWRLLPSSGAGPVSAGAGYATNPFNGTGGNPAGVDELGNPYAGIDLDADGRAGIEWGIYGVPETFVVGRDARIAYKLVGPITPGNFDSVLKPQIEKALAASNPSS